MRCSVLAMLLLLFTSASSAGAFQITEVIPSVSGSVRTTVFDGSTTTLDVPTTPLRPDSTLQIFEEDLGSTFIDVAGSGFTSITGSMRWGGLLYLDSVIGIESGVQHSARIYFDLVTEDLTGLVFVPEEPLDTQGAITATLRSEYRSGSNWIRTRYGFGFLTNYTGIITEVTLDWHYTAATNQLIFGGDGVLDLTQSSYDGWDANPQVTINVGAVVVPEPGTALFLGLGLDGLAAMKGGA